MKSYPLSRYAVLAATLTAVIAATQRSDAQAITWVPLADNQGTPALTQFCPGTNQLQPYLKFDPPVMPQKMPVLAYKAWLRTGPAITGPVVTALNDEGIWGTGPELSSSGTVSFSPTLILREGDATSTIPGVPTYGNGGTLAINNLQMSMRGDTVFQANLSSVGGKASLHDNCCLQIMAAAGSGAPYANLQPPVVDWLGENIGEWLFVTAANNGIAHFAYPPSPMLPCAPFVQNWRVHPTLSSAIAAGGVGLFRPTPLPIGSPAIGFNGDLLEYAVDSALPPARRPHLRICPPTGAPQFILNRSRDLLPAATLYYPGGARLGIYSPKLLCVSDPSIAGLWAAWQMSAMINSSSVTVVEPSLWVQRSIASPPECFVKRGISAPGTGSTFNNFYEMQIVDNTGGTGARWVFFGANLNSGARAIYVMTIQPGASSPLGPLTLIATDDVGFGTPLTIGPAPFIGGPLTVNITTLQPWFSTDLTGNIVFLAVSTGLPAGSQQVLCTASGNTPPPVVRSQQGMQVPTLTSGPAFIRRFDLAKPDQGVLSRGQAIDGAGDFAARILFKYILSSGAVTNGEGIYLGR